jgi:ATP-dependent Clp protease protease subunit
VADKTKKTEFEEILNHGVDFKNRRIYFGLDSDWDEDACGGEFTWSAVEVVVRALQKMASDYKHAPIELHMSSYGGQVDEMLRLYDAIQSCPCQIKFFGSGKIMSAATWIMAGCDERYLTPNTQVMLHKWRGGVGGETETDAKIEMDHYGGWLTDKLNEIFEENSKMPAEFWEEVTKRDLYLNPEECIALGLADFIVPYKKRGNLRRKRIAQMNKPVDKSDMRKLVNDINKRIHRGKNLKIELHIPEEEFDKDVRVEEYTPKEEFIEELKKTEEEKGGTE